MVAIAACIRSEEIPFSFWVTAAYRPILRGRDGQLDAKQREEILLPPKPPKRAEFSSISVLSSLVSLLQTVLLPILAQASMLVGKPDESPNRRNTTAPRPLPPRPRPFHPHPRNDTPVLSFATRGRRFLLVILNHTG